MANNKGKSNKRWSEVDAPSKVSKRLQRATGSPAVFPTIRSEDATGLPADQTTSFGQDNSLLPPSQSQLQSFSFTRNTTPEPAASNNSSEDSSIDLPALRPTLVETQSPIVAFTETGTQKFKKKVSPSKRLLRNTRPAAKKTWDVFGDSDSGTYLWFAATLDQYQIAYYYFHARLALVACGFTVDELHTIFDATMPLFIREGSEFNQKKSRKVFERTYNWVQDRLVERLCAYAKLWLKSEGGKDYKEQEIHAT